MKTYLEWENERNRKSHKLFTDILKEAFGDDGILIAHHLCFGGNEDSPNEIPSADCLIFDHEVMFKVFGRKFTDVLVELALLPADQRDEALATFFYNRERKVA